MHTHTHLKKKKENNCYASIDTRKLHFFKSFLTKPSNGILSKEKRKCKNVRVCVLNNQKVLLTFIKLVAILIFFF